MSIMVVDDSSVMRKIVIRSIRQAGFGDHDVDQAEDGVDALSQIKEDTPDVVLSDWNMPNMNGLELLKALRAESIDVPFGFVTSESTGEQRSLAVASGANFMLSKPFSADDLADRLGEFLD